MALTPRSGSSVTQSPPNGLPDNIPNSQADVLANMPFISDPALNKFAIDTTQYPQTTAQIVGFIKGHRVNVTYYRRLNDGPTSNRTNVSDLSTARNVIDTEYMKILNLEITLPRGFDFTANNAQTNMSISGQAMFYPNMNPGIGDIFLMGTGDGRVGVCRVSSVTPMSWRQDRVYAVNFVIQSFMDASIQDPIEGSVTIVTVFSKENYLGGTAALLSQTTYTQLLTIKEMRGNLCRLYHQLFFDTSLCSYLRPDTLYDPWVVQFMANKLSTDDILIRPKNLLGLKPQLYQQTLWARLEDRYNTSLYNIAPYCNVMGYRETRMGAFVTELIGHSILFPESDPQQGEPYIYSTNFYSGVTNLMTAEELLLYNAVTLRNSGDLTTFISLYLNTIPTLTVDQQFYKIPLYIHLIDMSLQSQYREIDAPSMNYAENGDSGS